MWTQLSSRPPLRSRHWLLFRSFFVTVGGCSIAFLFHSVLVLVGANTFRGAVFLSTLTLGARAFL
uniref:Uncharacterized protein n=1 Tax=Anguilla anguilla TaxID=7936 RepID=A0A0E9S9G1_ANGAN